MTDCIAVFELVGDLHAADDTVLSIEDKGSRICFKPTKASLDKLELLKVELQKWEIVQIFEWKHEDLVYDDIKTGSGENVHSLLDLSRGIISIQGGLRSSGIITGLPLLDNGSFVGVIIELENTSSLGLAVKQNAEYGVLLTDGTRLGSTKSHYSHCSTEFDKEERSDFYLRHK